MIESFDPSLLALGAFLKAIPRRSEPHQTRRHPSSGMHWAVLLAMILTLIVCGLGSVLFMLPPGFKFDNQWTGGVITVCGFAMFIIVVRREL